MTNTHEKGMKTHRCGKMCLWYWTHGGHNIPEVKEGVGRIKDGWMARKPRTSVKETVVTEEGC